MIVFGIHCNFFIVLPIRLKPCRSNGFLCFTMQNVRARKLSTSQRFSELDRHRTHNLSRPEDAVLIERIFYVPREIILIFRLKKML